MCKCLNFYFYFFYFLQIDPHPKILTNISQKDLNFLSEEISLTDYQTKNIVMFHQYYFNIIKRLRLKFTIIFLVFLCVSEESKPQCKISYLFEILNNK